MREICAFFSQATEKIAVFSVFFVLFCFVLTVMNLLKKQKQKSNQMKTYISASQRVREDI